ncbi:MAG: trehalose-6-phosphate synthase [Acidimicrobiia bacterium]
MSGITVVANRLPVRWDDAAERWVTSPGGLVSALAPILRARGGSWVGWTGVAGRSEEPFEVDGVRNVPVELSEQEFEDYYLGFCNGTIWPLYHDAIRPPEFHRHWWRPYRDVNRRFAEATAAAAGDGAVWVHDYQLQLVPGMLRELGLRSRIGFFLHIPFPPPEILARLPWRRLVLEGLLGADVLGFQTRRSMRNFAAAARIFAGATGRAEALGWSGRTVELETVPISIDVDRYEGLSRRPEVIRRSHEIRSELGDPEAVLLGVDRLDYTKGIDLRLRAFETLLDRRPDLSGRIVFVQIAVPSREGVDQYQTIRELIEQLVGRINGAHGRPEWTPVRYLYRSLPVEELVAFYRSADVMLVTPLRDGMNLVAKEYLATRTERTGVLVLSEFAGAAEQLDRALVVNPYDVDGLANTLDRAVSMPADEVWRRLSSLRRSVRRWDVYAWADHSLARLAS